MKSVSEHTVIQSAYKEAGTLRGAAAICGTTHKAVKRIPEAAERAEAGVVAVKRERNFDGAREVVAGKIDTCQGRISAKRLLVLASASGHRGALGTCADWWPSSMPPCTQRSRKCPWSGWCGRGSCSLGFPPCA